MVKNGSSWNIYYQKVLNRNKKTILLGHKSIHYLYCYLDSLWFFYFCIILSIFSIFCWKFLFLPLSLVMIEVDGLTSVQIEWWLILFLFDVLFYVVPERRLSCRDGPGSPRRSLLYPLQLKSHCVNVLYNVGGVNGDHC